MRIKVAAAMLVAALLLAGCGGSSPSTTEESVRATLESLDAQQAGATAGQTAAPPAAPAAGEPVVVEPPAGEPATQEPAAPPAEEPAAEEPPPEAPPSSEVAPAPDAPVPGAIDESFTVNLPPAMLSTETGLYASPNREELIAPVIIPAGETIYVMGRNATSSHLRAVWNTGVGWIPVSFTSYSGDREALAKVPVFDQEPPRCAVPVTTQFNLGSAWAAEQRMRVVVVVDLFRARYGDFPQSYLLLTVNGTPIESTRRPIVERGQFSLKDIVFSLPNYIQPGDTLGYLLETSSTEDLAFMATIFHVPDGCVWDVD